MFQVDNSYRSLPQSLWADVLPTPVREPSLLLFNQALAHELGLPELSQAQAALFFSGNALLAGSQPIAQAYAGHQFGHATILGDGRALLLGECIKANGQRVDIQLKGAGRTAFSRGGDGRAALAPMLREYLISEALNALGIPSARSLAVVATSESVQREYSQAGAIVTRVASSHLRVGTFQYAAWHSNKRLLPALLDYAIDRHYPDCRLADNPALAFLQAVMDAQLTLLLHWQRVGFVHGVLNTDNVTISGEALDFGPCAFMENYHADTCFSAIDRQKRYAFGRQPSITHWNMLRLAEALLPLIHEQENSAIELAEASLVQFMPKFHQQWQQMMCAKLGLLDGAGGKAEQAADAALIADWLTLLQQFSLDYTNAHLALMQQRSPCEQLKMLHWFARWQARTQTNTGANWEQSLQQMQQHNPAIIPRNHRVASVLDAAEQGDLVPFNELFDALMQPYKTRAQDDYFSLAAKADERVTKTFCGT